MTLGSSGWHQDQVADQLRISPRMLQRKLWALDFRDPG
ncbi:MAG: helix-turn-helix domain-containing protein [Longimicrobiales bacterium]